jgi:hypothetical protein
LQQVIPDKRGNSIHLWENGREVKDEGEEVMIYLLFHTGDELDSLSQTPLHQASYPMLPIIHSNVPVKECKDSTFVSAFAGSAFLLLRCEVT